MTHRFQDDLKHDYGIAPKIPGATATQEGQALSMAKFNNIAVLCMLTDRTQYGAACTFYIAEGTTSTQFSATRLATATLASNTTTPQKTAIEVRAEQLSDGYTWVRAEAVMAATATGQEISADCVRFNPRFAAP